MTQRRLARLVSIHSFGERATLALRGRVGEIFTVVCQHEDAGREVRMTRVGLEGYRDSWGATHGNGLDGPPCYELLHD